MNTSWRPRGLSLAEVVLVASVAARAAWAAHREEHDPRRAEPVRALRQHHAEGLVRRQPGSRPGAGDQGAGGLVPEALPERHREPQVLRAHRLPEDHPAGAQRRLGPRRRRGQPGLRHRRAARQGEADPAARQVREAVRLVQVLPARHDGAVPLDARRQDLRQGHRSGASPSSASRPASSTTRPSSKQYGVDPSKLPTTFAAFDKLLAQLRAEGAEQRAADRDRQQERLRVAARLRHGAGRLTAGASSSATGSST